MKGLGLTGIFAYLFYRSKAAFIFMIPLALYMADRMEKRDKEKRKQKQSSQFRDGILALSASLRAGHSAENAFRDAVSELSLLYGKEERMTKEFERVTLRTEMNVPLEQAVEEMASRCGIQDIQNFAEVFASARRSGGELEKMIQETVQTISGRLEVCEEIYTMLRGRQYEQRVMKAVPILLLIYMDATSPGFFSILYDTGFGKLIMTGCFVLYLAAWIVAERISDIKV
ncbi:type II secretion system F family protein [Qiania dongpingensis]|uniref:type II secretion system F family protein n=1 Tax=Qiania dongpingensis TaxID=2763669 RepID=UPI0020166FE4|nr:type II secretion system F family protein [Qiania dongpingensis]